jgi:hypothetical protein
MPRFYGGAPPINLARFFSVAANVILFGIALVLFDIWNLTSVIAPELARLDIRGWFKLSCCGMLFLAFLLLVVTKNLRSDGPDISFQH